MHSAQFNRDEPHTARLGISLVAATLSATVWTHALAGPLRALAGQPASTLADASASLSVAAIAGSLLAGLLGRLLGRDGRRSVLFASIVAGVAVAAVSILHPTAWIGALALLPAIVGSHAVSLWLASRLPASLEQTARARRGLRMVWLVVAALAVVQVGRLGTFISNPESDWFLSTTDPFYAKHQCLNAYLYGAELHWRGESNIYHASHYPALTRDAEPVTSVVGMAPEDPFQYPPPFLLLPSLALQFSQDYGAIRAIWFGLNFSLCAAALLVLARWVRGRAGTIAGLATPAILASFPVLYDLQYGQFHLAAIALSVLSLVSFQTRRVVLGGALLATAILSKLFPALLLIPLAVRRRYRELGWTLGMGAGASALSLAVLGPEPFSAFFRYHLPRLRDGRAFAFEEAWPEVADLVVAGNQGARGIAQKLSALLGLESSATLEHWLPALFAVFLVVAAISVGRRPPSHRGAHAAQWLGLLGLASLASAGAWTDYVPVTAVWLLAYLIPTQAGQPVGRVLGVVMVVFQATLIGTMPLGDAADPSWLLPVSLISALLLLATFVWGVWSERWAAQSVTGPESSPRSSQRWAIEAAGG